MLRSWCSPQRGSWMAAAPVSVPLSVLPGTGLLQAGKFGSTSLQTSPGCSAATVPKSSSFCILTPLCHVAPGCPISVGCGC